MPIQPYVRQDALNTLYDNMTVPVTASGNSATINWDVADGVPNSEIAIRVADMEGTGALVLELQDNRGGSLANTGHRFAIAGNGDYVWQIDNRMVRGSQFRIAHTWTAGTDGDGFLIHAHQRPCSLVTM